MRVRHRWPFQSVPPGGSGTESRFGTLPAFPSAQNTKYWSLQYAAYTPGNGANKSRSVADEHRASAAGGHAWHVSLEMSLFACGRAGGGVGQAGRSRMGVGGEGCEKLARAGIDRSGDTGRSRTFVTVYAGALKLQVGVV